MQAGDPIASRRPVGRFTGPLLLLFGCAGLVAGDQPRGGGASWRRGEPGAVVGARPAEQPWRLLTSAPQPTEVQRLPGGMTVVVSPLLEPEVGAGMAGAPGRLALALLWRAGTRDTALAAAALQRAGDGLWGEPPESLAGFVQRAGGELTPLLRPDYAGLLITLPAAALEPLLLRLGRSGALRAPGPTVPRLGLESAALPVRAGAARAALRALAYDREANQRDDRPPQGAAVAEAALTQVLAERHGAAGAVLALVGALRPEPTLALVRKALGAEAAARARSPGDAGGAAGSAAPVNVTEPLGRAERWQEQPQGDQAEVMVGYRLPPRGTRDHVSLAVLAMLLCEEGAGRLAQALVAQRALVKEVHGGVDWPGGAGAVLGRPAPGGGEPDDPAAAAFDFEGPTLLTLWARPYAPGERADHRPLQRPGPAAQRGARAVVAVMQAEVQRIAQEGAPPQDLLRAQVRVQESLQRQAATPIGRARALAVQQLLGGDAAALWELPARVAAVTAADLQRAARAYLTVRNRAVVVRGRVSQALRGP